MAALLPRRTAAERLNASIKNTATNSIDRGWIRLMGLTPLMLWLACLTAVRNQRILLARDKPSKTTPARRRRPATPHPQAPPRHRRATITGPGTQRHGAIRTDEYA